MTSLGEISCKNMKLLTLNEKCEGKKTKAELIDEWLPLDRGRTVLVYKRK